MIKIKTSYNAKVTMGHPAQEARAAKDVCDRLKADGTEDIEITTVSAEAICMYEYYGRNMLELDIHYFLEDGEVSFRRMLQSFHEAFELAKQYGRDIDEEERGKTVTAYVYDMRREERYPVWSHDDDAFTLYAGTILRRCRVKKYSLEPIVECNGEYKGYTLTWRIQLDEPNPLFEDGRETTNVRPVVIFPMPDGSWQTTYSHRTYESIAGKNMIHIVILSASPHVPIVEPDCGWEAMVKQER